MIKGKAQPRDPEERVQGPRVRIQDPFLSEEWSSFIGEGESPSLVVFQCGTPLTLLRVMTCGNASLAKGDVAGHQGAEGIRIACRKAMGLGTRASKVTQSLHFCKAMCLDTGVPKVTQGMARHEGAKGDTKLACLKAMWLGTGVQKATLSLHVTRQCG
ncbi:hypothetical protein L3X38_011886 [Prunus dulcis]|uniref:Uncharacterized protein n=1 Tax=Prunus dulcis TaxID=3755 RepID=A0AAD4WIL0_PRUDU|nr:hypothetical protein L3X38_011886 [Prunus dulcis]